MPPKTQNHLSLKQKREMAVDLQNNMSYTEAANKYNSSAGAVSRVKKQMKELLAMDPVELADSRKRVAKLKTEGLDELVLAWVRKARENHCVITGPILQGVAESIAKEHLNLPNFKASNGWLAVFRARSKVVCKALQGERGSAPVAMADEFKKSLPKLLEDYDPSNIFNGDEVGLFWEACAKKTLLLEGDDPAGTKVSKKRLTVFIVAAMDGHMEKMVVVNNSQTPRAFKAIGNNPNRLPSCIIWKSSKKAWMNWHIFRDWLLEFNAKLKRENRRGILFLDNFSAHSLAVDECEDSLTNLRVEWLPANCTSLVQPVDQGIGNALKVRYRKYLHEHMANMITLDEDPMSGVNILRVCLWLAKSFNTLDKTSTITRCFEKAGFIIHSARTSSLPEAEIVEVDNGEESLLEGEAQAATPEPDSTLSADVLIRAVIEENEESKKQKVDSESSACCDNMDDKTEVRPVISTDKAMHYAIELESFFLAKGLLDDAAWAGSASSRILKVLQESKKQTTLDDYYNID